MRKLNIILVVLLSYLSLLAHPVAKEPPKIEQSSNFEQSNSEKICQGAAVIVNEVYNNYSGKDLYDKIINRLEKNVGNFFDNGKTIERSKRYYQQLQEAYDIIANVVGTKSSISYEIERIRNLEELRNQGSIFPGYMTSIDRTTSQLAKEEIEKYLKNHSDDKIADAYSNLKKSYRSIERLSIKYDILKVYIRAQLARIVEKQFESRYISSQLEEKLKLTAATIGEAITLDKPAIIKEHEEKKSQVKEKKQQLEERLKNLNNTDADYAKTVAEIAALRKDYNELKLTKEMQMLENKFPMYLSFFSKYLEKPAPFLDGNSIDVVIAKISKNTNDKESFISGEIRNKYMSQLKDKAIFYTNYTYIKNGFISYRSNVLVVSILSFLLFFYIFFSVRRKKDKLFIRRIPGLDAIDNAVGRATEMGKPVIYNTGIGLINSPDTIASLLILKAVSKKVAQFKAEIIYPAYDPIVMQAAEEMISSGFLDAGCPEDHKKENIFFLVQDQFAYASGLAGLLARKKPASCFHLGYYAAESLLVSEAGFSAGAIQVAGTTAASQLPFFVAACDHTLIGEELYAAAAYLSRDPQIVSNLKLSDYGKVFFGVMFLLATILISINSDWTFIRDLFLTH